MIRGISHIGIGVSDIDSSLRFYRDFLGFRQVIFDYSGPLPGLEQVTRRKVEARIIMLANENASPIATGMVKLVQLLPPQKPDRPAVKYEWANIGIAEVSLSVQNLSEVYRWATVERGVKSVLAPVRADAFSSVAYVRDPDGTLIEFGEWNLYRQFEGIARIEGVNHVAIGVRDMDESMAFYKNALGFTEEILDYSGTMDIMTPMLPSRDLKMRTKTLANRYQGSWLEVFQHLPPYKPPVTGAQWGDLGHMEFAIDVSNIEKEYSQLQEKGVKFLCTPQTITLSNSDQWKYAYMSEPNGLTVSLSEY